MNLYMVIYDDGDCVCNPYSMHDECEGALIPMHGPVALFHSRKDAQTAIRISTNFTKLQLSQGKPANTDFTECRRYVKIVPAILKGKPTE